MQSKKRALILVDHGSVIKEANDMLEEIVKMIKQSKRCNFDMVCCAHMELARPTISEVFELCVSSGAEEIVVHPFFLFPGRHSTKDIPRMVSEIARNYPNVSYKVTPPLGIHPKIVDVIFERIGDV
jgi:sirohydrochlorin ferrochelatase